MAEVNDHETRVLSVTYGLYSQFLSNSLLILPFKAGLQHSIIFLVGPFHTMARMIAKSRRVSSVGERIYPNYHPLVE